MKSNIKCLLVSIFHRFWWVLGGKLGGKPSQDRLKIDPKRHLKNDEKKRASWRVLGGVRGGDGAPTVTQEILDPLKHQNQRKTPSTKAKGKKPRAKRTLLHARRASAAADIWFNKLPCRPPPVQIGRRICEPSASQVIFRLQHACIWLRTHDKKVKQSTTVI